ncbi:CID domain-containing protein [Aphelenchoides fujianensis]|nr:CID domain-containing protein [Aphelenchoides fujianensis]
MSTPRAAERARQDYAKTLQTLDSNKKLTINALTFLAEDYAAHAPEIVQVVAEAVRQAPMDQKLVRLYLVDSIVKNVGAKGDYVAEFAKELVPLFVHVFQRSDEEQRRLLLKLRNTWNGVFPRGRLYLLDAEVHQLDPKWPIALPGGGANGEKRPADPPKPPAAAENGRIYVNPKFVPKPAAEPPAAPRGPPITMSDALQKLEPKKSPAKPAEVKKEPAASFDRAAVEKHSVKSPVKPTTPKKAAAAATTPTKPKEAPKQPDEPSAAPKPLVKPTEASKETKESKELPMKPKTAPADPRLAPKPPESPKKRKADDGAPKAEGRASTNGFKIPKRGDAKPRDSTGVGRLLDAAGGASPPKPKRKAPPARRAPPPVEKRPRREPPPPHALQPTSAPGAHAFDLPAAVPPLLQPSPQPLLGPPRYGAPPPPFVAPPVSAPALFPPRYGAPPQIRNEQRLPNALGNNRIFVDGKAYEVLFLNDVAVIERSGVPHRVFFRGAPRDVIVDGVAHTLAFGETKPIEIDGQTHFIRFGAPSRELYMGDYPFRGHFGSGPPIVATINGRRHEIRLGGPPPEVKIEQDPCYELTRHLQAARLQQDPHAFGDAPPPLVAPKKEEDKLGDLLSKLARSGVLDSLSLRQAERRASPAADREATPPLIPATAAGGEEREAPAVPLAAFEPAALFVRYESVVRALLEARSVCPDCGVEIRDRESPAYKRHLDGHVRAELGAVSTHESRPDFLDEEAWIAHSFVDEVNRAAEPPAVAPPAADDAAPPADGQPGDALSSEVTRNECAVCFEKFAEYWDDDLEEWRLRDCVLVAAKPVHRLCAPDAKFDRSGPLDSAVDVEAAVAVEAEEAE